MYVFSSRALRVGGHALCAKYQYMLSRRGLLVHESVYVVMPAFNEGCVIASVIHRVHEILPDAHVVVINDGSSDNTASEATAAGARVVNMPFNCGYGVALQTGLTYAFRA